MNGSDNNQENNFKNLLASYLQNREPGSESTAQYHFDEDFLTSLIEGVLTEKENNFALRHLIYCRQCRHSVLANVNLISELEDGVIIVGRADTHQPRNNFQRIWQFLAENVFASADEAVFAYRLRSEESSDTIEIKQKNTLANSNNEDNNE